MASLRRLILTSMVGLTMVVPMTLPIQAKEDDKGTITVKLSEPVQGRSFKLYQVQDDDGNFTAPFQKLSEYLYGNNSETLQSKDMDTAKKVEAYIDNKADKNFQPYTKTYSNTEEFSGLDDGLYLVTQTEAPEGYEKMESFLVDIPYTIDSTHLTYSVVCNPKTEQSSPAATPVPSVKPEIKEKADEDGKTGLEANTALLYGIGTLALGIAILIGLASKKKERNCSGEL